MGDEGTTGRTLLGSPMAGGYEDLDGEEKNRLLLNPHKAEWLWVLRPPDSGDFPSLTLPGDAPLQSECHLGVSRTYHSC